jgi:MarR family transcriptional repressor of emrRAB
MNAKESRSKLFDAVEARIAVMRERIDGFPHQYVLLNRLIAHIHKGIQEHYHAVLKPVGLNYTSYTSLMMIYGAENRTLTPSDLAESSGEKPTNITRICDELLEKGLIERHPSVDDRRRIELTVTRKGRQLVEKLQPEISQALDDLYGSFSAGELKQYNQLLRKQLVAVEAGE